MKLPSTVTFTSADIYRVARHYAPSECQLKTLSNSGVFWQLTVAFIEQNV